MSSKERRERQKEGVRLTILDAARELFISQGYEQFSMRRIAERIDYSPTTIYLYFKDKDALLQAVCEESFGRLFAAGEKLRREAADPLVALRRAMKAYVEFGVENPHHYKVAFITRPVVSGTPDQFEQNDTMGRRSYNQFRHLVVEYLAARNLERDPDLTTQCLWSAIHGLTALLITHEGFPWHDRQLLATNLVDLLLNGLES
jgi:AcrR family transcriptional regulator